MKKKILILISGKLIFFSEQNINKIKYALKDDIEFFITPWEDTDKKIIKKFKKKYNPIGIKKIKKKNFAKQLKKIKYPDYGGNALGTLYMWDSLQKSFEEIKHFFKNKKDKPDYILRYRSDILPKNRALFTYENLKRNSIVIPDKYHWNGLNDQIFLIKFSDIRFFLQISSFIKKFIKDDRFFCSEFIFQQYLSKINFKIIFNSFDYNLMRFIKLKKINSSSISKRKILDFALCKLNKLKYKLRNFKNFYLQKNYVNKNQDIIIR